jgi:drug/metabolite transporter (DMT)-like permease
MAEPPTVTPDRRVGWALAASGILLVSLDAFFVRLADAPGATVAFLMACGSVITLGIGAVARSGGPTATLRRTAPMWRPLLLLAVLSAATQAAFIIAVSRTSVANVVVIVAAAPLAAALIARVTIGERPRRAVSVGIGMSAGGVALVMSGSVGSPSVDGDLIAVLAIVCFAGSIVVWRSAPDLDRPVTLATGSLMMFTGLIPFVEWSAIDSRALLAAGAMGAITNPLGRMLYSSAPRLAPAAEVAMFAPVETVAATAWVWIAFAEAPSPRTAVGGLVVVGAVVVATRPERRTVSASEPA